MKKEIETSEVVKAVEVKRKRIIVDLGDSSKVKIAHRLNTGDTVYTYHSDVKNGIYNSDGTVSALFQGERIDAKDCLALCRKIACIITGDSIDKIEIRNSVPDIGDKAPRHSVHWLMFQGVTTLKGSKNLGKK